MRLVAKAALMSLKNPKTQKKMTLGEYLWERTRERMIEKKGRNTVQKTNTLRERMKEKRGRNIFQKTSKLMERRTTVPTTKTMKTQRTAATQGRVLISLKTKLMVRGMR
jgi:hypothetical protein